MWIQLRGWQCIRNPKEIPKSNIKAHIDCTETNVTSIYINKTKSGWKQHFNSINIRPILMISDLLNPPPSRIAE